MCSKVGVVTRAVWPAKSTVLLGARLMNSQQEWCLIYITERNQGKLIRRLKTCHNEKAQALANFQTWVGAQTQNPLTEEAESHKEGICNPWQVYVEMILSVLHKASIAIYSGHCTLGKWENKIFWGLLDTGSEYTLISNDLRHYNGSPAGVGAYVGQIINWTLSYIWLTMGLLGVWTHLMFIS